MGPGTIHYIGFIRRKQGMTHADFSNHWGTIHRDLVMAFADPGPILQYIQDVSLEHSPAGFVQSFDGAPELWIRNEQALADLFAAERFQYAYAVDSPLFITMPATSFFVRDRVIADGQPGGIKLMRLIGVPKADDAGDFDQAWENASHPLGMALASPSRLVRSRILSAEAEGTDAAAYYGIECSWWPDAETAAQTWQARDAKAAGNERALLAWERIAIAAKVTA